jgi:hypothetical protein
MPNRNIIFLGGRGKTYAEEIAGRILGEVPPLEQFREINDNGLPLY